MRSAPAAAPLTAWVEGLIANRTKAGLPAEIPMADPADAGVNAEVLLLLEAPGPMTNVKNARAGSGFIVSDNNDATAENLWRAWRAAGLKDQALIWNIVPWTATHRCAPSVVVRRPVSSSTSDPPARALGRL